MGEKTESKIRRTTQTMKQLADSDIKEFLENVPLYVWREFSRPAVNRESLWIKEIDAFCENCQQLRPFQDMRSTNKLPAPDMQSLRGFGHGSAVETGTSYFEFTCVSCGKSKRRYLVQQIVDEKTITIPEVW